MAPRNLSVILLAALLVLASACTDTSAPDHGTDALDTSTAADTTAPSDTTSGSDTTQATDATHATDTSDDAPQDTDTAQATDTSSAPDDAHDADASDADADADADTAVEPMPRLCTGAAFPRPQPGQFDHAIVSAIIVASGDPEHSAQDVMVPPDAAVTLPGKFAYGRISKDLEDETIHVMLDDCSGWQALGSARTNSDGRTAFALDPMALGLDEGVYEVRQVVRGDASDVQSFLRLRPVGTKLVVIDIDGTLTTSDAEVFQDAIDEYFFPLYDGEYLPEPYPGAVELTWALHDRGYELVYLTGRPYWLTRITRDWLAELGFAPGHLHLTDSNGEALPTESGVGAYKRDYLLYLQSLGYVLDAAYGNATTDIYAYAAAGIDPARTWIIGDHGGEGGTQALSGGYVEHLAMLP